MSMSQSPYTTQSYCLFSAGLDPTQEYRLSVWTNHLSTQAPYAVELSDCTTQESCHTYGSCVSPELINRELQEKLPTVEVDGSTFDYGQIPDPWLTEIQNAVHTALEAQVQGILPTVEGDSFNDSIASSFRAIRENPLETDEQVEFAKERVQFIADRFSETYASLKNSVNQGNKDAAQAYGDVLIETEARARNEINEIIKTLKDSGVDTTVGSSVGSKLQGTKGQLARKRNLAKKQLSKLDLEFSGPTGQDSFGAVGKSVELVIGEAGDKITTKTASAIEKVADKLDVEIGENVGETFANTTKSKKVRDLIKEGGVNGIGFAAGVAGNALGPVGSLASEAVASGLARKGVTDLEATIDAFRELVEDESVTATNALSKVKQALEKAKQTVKDRRAETGEELSKDATGFIIGNATSAAAQATVGKIPLVGAGAAIALNERLHGLKDKVMQQIVPQVEVDQEAGEEHLNDQLSDWIANIHRQLQEALDKLFPALEIDPNARVEDVFDGEELKNLQDLIDRAEKAADQYDSVVGKAEAASNENFQKSVEDLNKAIDDINPDSIKEVNKEVSTLDKLGKKAGDTFSRAFSFATSLAGLAALTATLGKVLPDAIASADRLQKNRLSLGFAIDGDVDESIAKLRKQTNDLGLDFENTLEGYKSFAAGVRNTPIEGELDTIFSGFLEGGAARGIDSQRLESTLRALSQIASKSRVSLEELTGQLGEAYPGALQAAAAATGQTQRELIKLVETGNVMAEDLLPAMARQLSNEAFLSASNNLQTLSGQQQIFNNRVLELQQTLGQRYLAGAVSGASKLNVALKFLTENIDAALGVGRFLVLTLATHLLRSVNAFGIVATAVKSLTTSLVAGAVSGQLLQRTIQGVLVAARAITSALVVPAVLFTAFEALRWLATNGKEGFEDSSKAIDSMYRALKKAADASQDIKTDFGPKRASGFGRIADFLVNDRINDLEKFVAPLLGLEPELIQTFADLQEKNTIEELEKDFEKLQKTSNITLKNLSNPEGLSNFVKDASALEAEIKSLTTTLTILRSSGLEITDPLVESLKQELGTDNTDQIVKVLIERISALREARGQLDQDFLAGGTATIQTQIDNLKRFREQLLEKEQTNGFDLSQQIAETDTKIKQLTRGLDTANDALKAVANQTNNVALAFSRLDAAIANTDFDRELRASARRAQILSNQVFQSQEERDAALTSATKQELNERLRDLRSHNARRLKELENLSVNERRILESNLGTTIENAGIGDVQRAFDRIDDPSPNIEKSLEKLREFSETRQEIASTEEELARTISDTRLENLEQTRATADRVRDFRRSLEEVNESYQDFYRDLAQQAKETAIDLENLAREIQVTDFKTALKRALTPGIDSIASRLGDIVTGLVEEANSILDQENSIQLDAITAQREALDRRRQLRDLTRQQNDLLRDEAREQRRINRLNAARNGDFEALRQYAPDAVLNPPTQNPGALIPTPPPAPSTTQSAPTPRPTSKPTSSPLSKADFEVLKKIVLAEALSEGKLGQALVARAIFNRSSVVRSGKLSPGTFLSKSGGIRDIVYGRNQFQPVSDGSINRPRSQAQLQQASEAIRLALNPKLLGQELKKSGVSGENIAPLLNATGFRTGAAFNDPSQNFNRVQFRNHVFNSDRFSRNLDVRNLTDRFFSGDIPSGIEPTPESQTFSPSPEDLVQMDRLNNLTQEQLDLRKQIINSSQNLNSAEAFQQFGALAEELERQGVQISRQIDDTKDSVANLSDNVDGLLTRGEERSQLERQLRSEYRGQIRSLEDQELVLKDQLTDFEDKLNIIRQQAAQHQGISGELEKQIPVLQRQAAAYNEQLDTVQQLKQEAISNEEQAVQAGLVNFDQDKAIQAREFLSQLRAEAANLEADFATDPFTEAALRRVALEEEHRAAIERKRQELERFLDTEGIVGERADLFRESLERINDLSFDKIRQETSVLFNTISGPLESLFTDLFTNAKKPIEALRDFALSILQNIAKLAAQTLTRSILGSLFSSAAGGIGGFAEGGPVAAFANGGVVEQFADGGAISNFMNGGEAYAGLGLQVAKAMKKEGPKAVPIVASVGEQVLSTRNGDAQLFRAMQRNGMWRAIKAGKIGNFSSGGVVTRVSTESQSVHTRGRSRDGFSDRPMANNVTYNVYARDADSFNETWAQKHREQEAMLSRAKRRSG